MVKGYNLKFLSYILSPKFTRVKYQQNYSILGCVHQNKFHSFLPLQNKPAQNKLKVEINSSPTESPSKILLESPALIELDGFKVETHRVTTKDGYILTIFRVNSPKKDPCKGPVLLQHGLLSSSDDWIVRRPCDDNLPYMLADNGYDVFMGNFRGCEYSMRHRTLDPDDMKFWNFSFHEMGQDLISLVDGVLRITNSEKLAYIGYSMGATVFFVGICKEPNLNNKISQMIALAPAAHIGQTTSPFKRFANTLSPTALQMLFDGIIGGHVVPLKISLKFKRENKRLRKVNLKQFEKYMRFIDGPNPGQITEDTIEMLMGHSPADTSSKTLAHFHQLWLTNKFQYFDYGAKNNLIIYESKEPPQYKLSKVTCPVSVLYGLNDKLIVPEDIQKTVKELGNVKYCESVKNPLFNHLDFVYGKDAGDLVYKQCLQLLDSDAT